MNIEKLKDKTVEEEAATLCDAISTMRVHGFYIQRDEKATGEMQQDAISTSCLMLGVEPTNENRQSDPVMHLAQTLFENAQIAGQGSVLSISKLS